MCERIAGRLGGEGAAWRGDPLVIEDLAHLAARVERLRARSAVYEQVELSSHVRCLAKVVGNQELLISSVELS